MKESDSITAHLNDYEGIISQLSAQLKTIDDELKSSIADEHSSTILGNLRHDHLQRVGTERKVLRNNELHSIGRRSEEDVRSELGK
jgi:hypothetical protein